MGTDAICGATRTEVDGNEYHLCIHRPGHDIPHECSCGATWAPPTMSHQGRTGSTDCNCAARRLGGVSHHPTCAARQADDGHPYTDVELSAAHAVEQYIMSRDGGEVDVREMARRALAEAHGSMP